MAMMTIVILAMIGTIVLTVIPVLVVTMLPAIVLLLIDEHIAIRKRQIRIVIPLDVVITNTLLTLLHK